MEVSCRCLPRWFHYSLYMVRVALAQMDPVVGDIDGNVGSILDSIRRATELGAQVAVFPELAVTGYPPEDLLLKRSFIDANLAALDKISRSSGDMLVVVGFVDAADGNLFNAAGICFGGEVISRYHKQLLPNYGVFDEKRYFTPGERHTLIETPAGVIGVCVCEDAWYDPGPVIAQGDAGAQIVLNINASPFHRDKLEERTTMLGERARRARTSIVYVNCVGGQDELVFDGGSLVVDPTGATIARFPQFERSLEVVEVPLGEQRAGHSELIDVVKVKLPAASSGPSFTKVSPVLSDAQEVYGALVLGVRDYVHKNGFTKVTLGLSGGVDSALTAVIAADAVGPENVIAVSMPSGFSSEHSKTDAEELATGLGVEYRIIPIGRAYETYVEMLADEYGSVPMGVAEENLQARVRGNILMAISNRYGPLVLTTGNKSEMAVGYATLYGDMAGGLAVLKDVFKTEVYDLCRWRNEVAPVIPENILTKPPSAELRPDQKDEDSLPPYEVLDRILEAYIEEDRSIADIVTAGNEPSIVEHVIRLVDRAEYKRRQAPPGIKVTTKAFGRDRRLPITNRWREDARRDGTSMDGREGHR